MMYVCFTEKMALQSRPTGKVPGAATADTTSCALTRCRQASQPTVRDPHYQINSNPKSDTSASASPFRAKLTLTPPCGSPASLPIPSCRLAPSSGTHPDQFGHSPPTHPDGGRADISSSVQKEDMPAPWARAPVVIVDPPSRVYY
eukprot:3611238-Rhodomonas_salina.1